MHTVFELPSPWTSERSGELRVWTRADSGVRVEVDPLYPLPIDRKQWGERVLSRNLVEGGSIRQSEIYNSVTDKGWPTTLVSTAALDAGGAAIESRITLFFEFVYYGTAIAVRIPAAEVGTWEREMREVVVGAMLAAEPDLTSAEVANVAELWDMEPTPRD